MIARNQSHPSTSHSADAPRLTSTTNRLNHQNSDLDALPVNSEYF
ncbi:unannotated protein [freshwater metagenome]|uniref:Unannotated protein n=1 Tax=freshwater metagenome TaxID=449393 RepID=A0A6J6KLY0_9ZZZZ